MNWTTKSFIGFGLGLGGAGLVVGVATPLILNAVNKPTPITPVTPVVDQKQVDAINDALKGTSGFDTMSELVLYLSIEKSIDLEGLVAYGNTQYVWDQENNVIFTIDEQGNPVAKPNGYTINSNKHKIWKMVDLPSSNGKTDIFVKHSEYGQYLRTSETLPSAIKFSSNIDTGFNENLQLTYEKPESISYIPKVVTYRSDLVIEGTIGDIDHYGIVKSITVDQIPSGSSYNEYGLVESEIKVAKATVVAKPSSEISGILLTSNNSKVKLEIDKTTQEPALVGSIGKTEDVSKKIEDLIDEKDIPEESKPEIVDKPIVVGRYKSGLGTEICPYAISTSQQLLNCQEDVNTNNMNACSFILTNDINMNGVTTFSHIGTPTSPFTGTFDGQGYTISNLKIVQDIDPTSTEKVYAGLFGWIKGSPIEGCTRETIWDNTEKKVNYDTCLTQYTTYVKNINIKNVNNTAYADVSARYIGGIAGRVSDALVYNCHVESGTIKSKKHLGGIAGTMSNSLFYNCSTGTGLTIECWEYNAGGICGSASGDPISNASCDVFAYCTNNAAVRANSKAAVKGNLSGIVALAGSSAITMGTVIDHCTNNGNITSKNQTGTGYCPSPSGICSDAHRTYIVSNCINNGEIKIENNYQSEYASGIVSYSEALIYKCQNNKKISGKSDWMAGILANQSSDYFCINEFYDVSNNGEIVNNNESGITGQIVAGSGVGVVLIDKHYNNVDELNAEISSTTGVSITLKNVVVDDTSGTLNILPSILSVSSDRKICSNVAIAGTSVTIDLPNTNITVSGAHDTTYLYLHGDNSNLIVNSGASLLAASVGGANSTLTNNGTIQSFNMTNKCVDSTNNVGGFIGNIGFDDASWKGSTPLSNKHFTNKGTIHTQGRECHTISTISDTVKITLENYGTIKSENSWYLFLFYTNQKCVVKSYAGSVAEVAGTSAGLYATRNTIIAYYQKAKGSKEEAKIIDKGVTKKWTDITWYIEHHEIL